MMIQMKRTHNQRNYVMNFKHSYSYDRKKSKNKLCMNLNNELTQKQVKCKK